MGKIIGYSIFVSHSYCIPVLLSFSLAGSWPQVWSPDEFRYQPDDPGFDEDDPGLTASFTCPSGWIIPGRYVNDPLA